MLREKAADTGERAAGTDADHHRVDIAFELRKDFRAGGAFVRQRIGGIGELVGIEGAGNFGGDLLGHVLVIFGMALADIGAGHAHLGAQSAQMLDLLARHLVGHDEDDAVALGNADLGEAEAGVAGGGLDDGAAALQPAILLGGRDHRQRDAVLDRATGVLALELDEQPALAGIEFGELDHRCLADQVEHGGVRRTQPRQNAFRAVRRRFPVHAHLGPSMGSSSDGIGRHQSAHDAAERHAGFTDHTLLSFPALFIRKEDRSCHSGDEWRNGISRAAQHTASKC